MRIYFGDTQYGRLMKGSVRACIPEVTVAQLVDSEGYLLTDSEGYLLLSQEFKIKR